MDERAFRIIRPSDRRRSDPAVPGTSRWVICDDKTPTNGIMAGIVELSSQGDRIPMHYHRETEELQYIVSGSGVVRDNEGNEYPVEAGTAVYCGAGSQSAHEFENTENRPLIVLFIYPSPGGSSPDVSWYEE